MMRGAMILCLGLALACGSALAQDAKTGSGSLRMDPDQAQVTLAGPAGAGHFGIVSGVIEYSAPLPTASTLAFSFDATSLSDAGLQTALDAARFPELRLASVSTKTQDSGKGRMNAVITIADVPHPFVLLVRYQTAADGTVRFHGEGDIPGALATGGKNSALHLVIDAPFHRLAN